MRPCISLSQLLEKYGYDAHNDQIACFQLAGVVFTRLNYNAVGVQSSNIDHEMSAVVTRISDVVWRAR